MAWATRSLKSLIARLWKELRESTDFSAPPERAGAIDERLPVQPSASRISAYRSTPRSSTARSNRARLPARLIWRSFFGLSKAPVWDALR